MNRSETEDGIALDIGNRQGLSKRGLRDSSAQASISMEKHALLHLSSIDFQYA